MKKTNILAVVAVGILWALTGLSEPHAGGGTENPIEPVKVPCNVKQGISFVYFGENYATSTIRIESGGQIKHSGDEQQFAQLKQNRLAEKLASYCATVQTTLNEFPEFQPSDIAITLNKNVDLDPAFIRTQLLSSNYLNQLTLHPKAGEKMEANAGGKSSWTDLKKEGLNAFAARNFATLYGRFMAMCANPKSNPYWLPETGKHFTPENLNNFSAELAEAERLKSKDIAAADAIKSGVANQLQVSKKKGRDPERVGEHGLSQVFLSFFKDFAGKANDDKSYCKFAETMREALLDPAFHRTILVAGNPMNSSEISYSAVFDALERKLSGEPLKTFRELRKAYRLTPEQVIPVESAYAHGTSQFAQGAILTHKEKAHDLPTEYVALLKNGDRANVIHRNQARDGWVITAEGRTLSKSQKQNPSDAISAINEKHSYNISRTFEDYASYFDDSFTEKLAGLKRNSHVLDMGSGKGFFMEGLTQGFTADEKASPGVKALAAVPASDRPHATGVTIQMGREMPKFDNNRMRVFEKYLDKVSDEELIGKKTAGLADVITDVYGVFSYVDDVTGLLERYARLMKPKGSIYIVASKSRNIVKVGEKEVPLFDYLASLKDSGIKISNHSKGKPGDLGMLLERTGQPLKLPKLELETSVEGEPPHRVFVVKPFTP